MDYRAYLFADHGGSVLNQVGSFRHDRITVASSWQMTVWVIHNHISERVGATSVPWSKRRPDISETVGRIWTRCRMAEKRIRHDVGGCMM